MSESNALFSIMLNEKNGIILCQQAKIDELQKRIDEALIKLNDARNNGVDKSHYEAIKILKGKENEN